MGYIEVASGDILGACGGYFWGHTRHTRDVLGAIKHTVHASLL